MKIAIYILIVALCNIAASQFTELSPEEYGNNQTILECLNFGTSHIMREAVENGTLPDGPYEITQVNKVEQQAWGNTTDYRFEFEIAGPQNADITGFVIVNYELATEAMNVTDFKYHFEFHYGEESTESFESWEGSAEEAEFSWENYEFEFSAEEGFVGENEEWMLGEDDFINFN